MGFMQPEIIHEMFLIVETTDCETAVFPADVACHIENPDHLDMDEAPQAVKDHWEHILRPYLESRKPIQSITAKIARGARSP
jgi:hypothetical protein